MDEDSSNAREEPQTLAPSIPIRLVAFLMDFILLSLIGTLIGCYLPSLLGVENEFDQLLSRFAEILEQKVPDEGEIERLQKDIYLFQGKIYLNFFLALTFVSYFLLAEIFCKGKTIGKATFSLMTVDAGEVSPPSFRQILIRSLLKGLSITVFELGLANFLFCIFNRDKKCLHDFASGTITIRSNSPTKNFTNKPQQS